MLVAIDVSAKRRLVTSTQNFLSVQEVDWAKASQPVFPYKKVQEHHPDFGVWEPTKSASVAHSIRDAATISRPHIEPLAVENIHGSRRRVSNNASLHKSLLYVSTFGGFIPRGKYVDDLLDLSTHENHWGETWGRYGPPELGELLRANCYKISSTHEAAAALHYRCGLVRQSLYPYQDFRDENGCSEYFKENGESLYVTSIIGYDGRNFLCQASAGDWNTGPKKHEQPDGSFWVSGRDLHRDIVRGDVYALRLP